ncbi:ABC transporter ATP-binding protein [Microbacteriaceae bacterium VKM Ac-2855]|nr:ABC transporter ATP-binding protein [Microbacteriaceae bacterium VKM Ac-2855]
MSALPAGTWPVVRAGIAASPGVLRGWWLTALIGLIAASGRVAVPLTVQYAIDDVLTPGGERGDVASTITVVVLIGFGGVVAAGLSSLLMNRRLIAASERAIAGLRSRAFAHILAVSPARLPAERRSALVSRVTNDADTLTQFVQSGGITLVINAAQMLVSAAIMLSYSWLLAIVVFLVSILAVVGMRLFQRSIAGRYQAVRTSIAGLYGRIGETVRGVEIIRAYGVAARNQAAVDDAIEQVHGAQLRTLWPLNANTAVGEAASGLITATVVVAGVALGTGLIGGGIVALSAGQLVAFLFLITFFVRPLQFSVSILGEAQGAVAGWRRILEILALPTGAVSVEEGTELPSGAVHVAFDGVGFSYNPGTPVLRGIDVRIPAGTHVAVVGETGSGKTTFAKLLTRQLEPAEGLIRLNGVDLGTVADAALARRVAIVPQEAFVFDRTVLDNIAIARPGADEATVRGVLRGLGLEEWADALPNGLHTRTGQRGEALSAGERQLIALARTALVDPDLLVLDEATSGVDPATDVRVQRALAAVTRGRTTVTIAHRMITAEGADTVLLFAGGRLAEQGSHAELVALGGRYAALHRAWAGVKGEA